MGIRILGPHIGVIDTCQRHRIIEFDAPALLPVTQFEGAIEHPGERRGGLRRDRRKADEHAQQRGPQRQSARPHHSTPAVRQESSYCT